MMNKFFRIILGFLIISYLLYVRLFIIRASRDLYTNLDYLKISLYFYILTLMFLLLLYNIYKLFMNSEKNDVKHYKNKYLNLLTIFWNHPGNPVNIIQKSMISFDAFIKNHTPDYDGRMLYSDYIIQKTAKILLSYPQMSINFTIIIRNLIQLLVCSVFCIETLFYNHFNYFYKIAWLLILPMLLQYVFYSISNNIHRNLESLNDVLLLKVILKKDISDEKDIYNEKNIADSAFVSIEEAYTLMQYQKFLDKDELIYYHFLHNNVVQEIPSISAQNLILEYAVKTKNFFFDVKAYLEKYNKIKEKIEITLNIIKYGLYSLSWGYILLYGLNLI